MNVSDAWVTVSTEQFAQALLIGFGPRVAALHA